VSGKAKGSETARLAQRERFLLELRREIKAFERQAELYRASEVEITPALLDSRLLLPEKEASRGDPLRTLAERWGLIGR